MFKSKLIIASLTATLLFNVYSSNEASAYIKDSNANISTEQSVETVQYPNSYKLIKEGLSKFEKEIKFDISELDYKEVKDIIYNEFYYKNPSKYFIESWGASQDGTLFVKYTHSYNSIKKMTVQMETKANSVLNEIIKPGFNDYQKVRAIHDYIVLNTEYDYERQQNKTLPIESNNIYGALIDGIAVCEGYARTLSYLLDKVEIENYYLTGHTKSGSYHAWNLVKLNENYYYIDSTWNDPIPNIEGQVNHDYFLVDEDTLSKTHEWDKSKYPEATNTKYIYQMKYEKAKESREKAKSLTR